MRGQQKQRAKNSRNNARAQEEAEGLPDQFERRELTSVDLGNLRTSDTGAMRTKDADNERYDLISPIALRALAQTYKEGADKYGAMNWERGFPVSDLLNHAIRHIFKFLEGDRSEPHLPHAMWGLAASIHSLAVWPELNRDLRGPGCVAPGLGNVACSPTPEDGTVEELKIKIEAFQNAVAAERQSEQKKENARRISKLIEDGDLGMYRG